MILNSAYEANNDMPSLLAQDPLLPSSFLSKSSNKSFLKKFNVNEQQKSIKNTNILDKPVNFGRKIKSSGYINPQTNIRMFQPMYDFKAKNLITSSSNKSFPKILSNPYPMEKDCMDWSISKHFKLTNGKLDRISINKIQSNQGSFSNSIFSLSYSDIGEFLAIGSTLGVTNLINFGLRNKTFTLNHSDEMPVTAVSWARHRNSLLTTGPLGVHFWTINSHMFTNSTKSANFQSTQLHFRLNTPQGVISNARGQTISVLDLKNNKKTALLPKIPHDEFRFAKFHVQDSFFHLAIKDKLCLYSYKLNDPDQDIIQKCHESNFCKLRASFSSPKESQRITATASSNIFYSLFFATSNKTLSVIDLNKEQIIWHLENSNEKGISSITLNQGSIYCDSRNYSQFATYSPGYGVEIWDLRSDPKSGSTTSLSCFEEAQHFSSSSSISDSLRPQPNAVFSPCGRYIAVGSPVDNKLALFDIRWKSGIPMLQMFTNTESLCRRSMGPLVAWSPKNPEISQGFLNGSLIIHNSVD